MTCCDQMKRTTFIFVGILLAAILLSGCAEPTEKATSESEDITIGALLPLTGNLASIGEASQAALVVSARDINGYFSGLGSGKNVEVIVKDTESNPETALEKLKELHDRGITIVIGPQSSSEAEAVLDYANENGITLLSTASTAPSLAIPDDNLFRLVPDDTKQGMVLATFMNEEGTSAVIPIYVDDVWGNGLVDEIGANFEELNGTMIDGVAYDTETTNFSAEVESLNEKVVAATSEYEDGKVAVLICSYGEVTNIFALAQNYPALSDVDWYATDGIALNNELITDEDAAAFAATTNVKAAMYGYVRANDMYQIVGPEIEEELGRMPDSYALAAYDALWLATFVDLDSIPENDDSVKLAMTSLTNTYYGVSGWTILDDNGDRKYWDYDVWAVSETDGTYQWELYGKVLLPYKNNMVIMRGEELTFA